MVTIWHNKQGKYQKYKLLYKNKIYLHSTVDKLILHI
jgi:hypothetical protein